MWQQALVDNAPANLKAEISLTVGSVEPHPRSGRLPRFWYQPSVVVEHAPWIGGEIMGEDIAAFEHRQQAADNCRIISLFGIADVDHQLDSALACRAFSQSRHFHPEDFQRRRDHACFDPTDQTLVTIGDAQSSIQIDTALSDNVWDSRKPGLANLEERDNFIIALRTNII